jgi:hypothetical protein
MTLGVDFEAGGECHAALRLKRLYHRPSIGFFQRDQSRHGLVGENWQATVGVGTATPKFFLARHVDAADSWVTPHGFGPVGGTHAQNPGY